MNSSPPHFVPVTCGIHHPGHGVTSWSDADVIVRESDPATTDPPNLYSRQRVVSAQYECGTNLTVTGPMTLHPPRRMQPPRLTMGDW